MRGANLWFIQCEVNNCEGFDHMVGAQKVASVSAGETDEGCHPPTPCQHIYAQRAAAYQLLHLMSTGRVGG